MFGIKVCEEYSLYMKDVQNTKGDFLFNIDSVGVDNFIHPISLKVKEGGCINTIGNFSLSVSLEKDIRGINMSRLPIFVSELNEDEWSSNKLKYIMIKLRDKLESKDASISVEFDYFIKKRAPVSGYESVMNYSCKIETSVHKNEVDNKDKFDTVVTVEVPITTLCPCSKEISDYSAHNQRAYVSVSLRYNKLIWIEEIVEYVESVASCEIYPILKRVDEKYVTEKAYNNPRFVEDIVRLVAEKLFLDDRIIWFSVKSRHMESIHRHNAFAKIEYSKQLTI